MRHSSALIATCLVSLAACTPYSGAANKSADIGDMRPTGMRPDEQLTRTDCFWRFQTRPQDANDTSGAMIFAMSASKHVARIQLDGILYRLDIKSSVVANPLVYGAKGLSVKVNRKSRNEDGRMDAVLALTTPAGLSKVMPVVGREECP